MCNSKTSVPQSGLGQADTLAFQGPENKDEPLADVQGLTPSKGADQPQAFPYALPAGLVAFLSACGGGSGSGSSGGSGGSAGGGAALTPEAPSTSGTTGAGSAAPVTEVLPASGISQSQASRFLQHAQFSARYDEIKAVQTLGYGPWLAQAMAMPSSQGGWEWLKAKGYDAINEREYFFKDNLTN